jgi:hypothetical protein
MEYQMPNPTRIEVNCTTGEVLEIELTDSEVAQIKLDSAKEEAQRAEKEAADNALALLKTSAKAKLVAGEPLTEEEASVLVI